jgi:hypothetical protein
MNLKVYLFDNFFGLARNGCYLVDLLLELIIFKGKFYYSYERNVKRAFFK